MTDLITRTKERFNHAASRKYLESKYTSKLLFANQGGLWIASPELIAYLKNAPETSILIDSQNTPIKIDSLQLLTQMESLYNSTMEEYYTEFSELTKKR
jgi:hypothetical protein